MNKLDELIEKLCPNGVEYKALAEFATITRGGNFQKKDFIEDGVPCIHYGQIYTRYGLFANETFTFIPEEVAKKQRFAQPNDIVMAVTSENIEDVCKCVGWLGDKPVAVSGHSAIIHHNQNVKYLAYFFHSAMFFAQKRKIAQGTKVIEVSPDKLNRVKVPVPPLEVQAEIVRILDNFTVITTKLKSELSAELTARKKQFEYYRDELLSFDISLEEKSLGDIFDIVTDYVAAGSFASIAENVKYKKEPDYAQLVRTTDIKSNFTKNDYVFIDKKAFEFLWRVNLDIECIIMPNIGVNCGEVYYLTPEKLPYKNNALAPNALLLRSSTNSNKFLSYFFQTKPFQDKLRKIISPGGQTKFNKTELKKIKIRIPNLDIQNKIVNVLDNFEALCNDISEGIPAEIEARQKQYEYYRDKLLTFTMKE